MSEHELNDAVMALTAPDGSTVYFQYGATIPLDGQDYVVLVEMEPDQNGEEQLLITRLEERDDKLVFVVAEDEDVVRQVFEMYTMLALQHADGCGCGCHGHEHGDGCCGHGHGHEHGDGCCGHGHGHEHGDGCCGHGHGHEHEGGCCGHGHGHEHEDGCCGHGHGHEHEGGCCGHGHEHDEGCCHHE